MNFIQQYSRVEGLTGIKQYVRFVISNTYEELFLTSGIPVDIYLLESKKEDLNIDEGSFAIDELSFSINQGACTDANAKNALAFTLEAKDVKVNRYCALFFPESETSASTVENNRFIGKVKDKVDWEDKVWQTPLLYTDTPNAIRQYKFSALSFDVSVLEKCELKKTIYKIDPNTGSKTKTPNIYEMIADGGSYKAGVLQRDTEWNSGKTYKPGESCKVGSTYYKFVPLVNDPSNPATSTNQNPVSNPTIWINCGDTAIVDIFDIKSTISSPTSYLRPIGNLYKALNEFYLKKASIILNNLLNTNITFNLKTASLGFNVTQGYLATNNATNITENLSGMAELKLNANNNDSIFIHRRMIKAQLGGNDEEFLVYSNGGFYKINDPSARVEFPTPSAEKSLSFESLNNVSELLFELARALGCYVFATTVTGNQIDLEFRSRQNLLENDLTYVIGATNASGNTAVATSNDPQAFYSSLTPITTDGLDTIWSSAFSDGTLKEIPSGNLNSSNEERKAAKENKGIEYKRLLLSTGVTVHTISDGWTTNSLRYMLNSLFYDNNYKYFYDPLMVEHLCTGIYVSNDGTKYAPAYKVYAKLNGETIKGGDGLDGCTLSEYINTIMGHDKSYYETEYEWTVPCWNGFSKHSDGSNPSWKNIKLGSKIVVKDKGRVYNKTTGEWVEITDPNGIEFVVVGIETSLDKPETKIKLHFTSRFAYSLFYDPGKGETPLSGSRNINLSLPVKAPQAINTRILICAGSIKKGSAVRINSNGKILQSESNADYQGSTIGIALQSGENGDAVSIACSGEVTLDIFNFTSAQIGKYIGVRTNANMNLSTNILNAKSATENLRLIVGKITSSNSIVLNIDELELK